MSEQCAVVWEVTLPDRRQSLDSYGRARLRATLTVTTNARGTEAISIPVAVGKALVARSKGEQLDPSSRAELLYELRETSLRCAASRIERLVDKRDYSATELDDKLLHDGYSASVRDEAIGRAIGAGLVDDRRFGAAYVRTKLSSGWGVARIERELKRRGVCLEELPGWPQDFLDDKTEDERAYRIASTRGLSQKNPFEKLVRFLCGRGFSMGCAMRVARRVMDEQAAAEQ